MKNPAGSVLPAPGVLAIALALIASSALVAQGPANIVVILVDDQRMDQLEGMPTLQAELVGRGTSFTNAFVSDPTCCPSRASILTGLYVFRHGVISHGPNFLDFDDSSTHATWLDAAGYRTGYVGKYFQSYGSQVPYIPPGWDDFRATFPPSYFDYQINENGTIVPYGSAEADYSTDVTTQQAVEFLESAQGEPFLLVVGYNAPHRPAKPALRHNGSLRGTELPKRPNFNEADVSDKPAWVQALPLLANDVIVREDRGYAKQLESLLALDEGLASILQTLDAIGAADNTAIIYSNDNGISSGEHRWSGKECPYDECVRVPLIVRLPGDTTPRENDELVLNVDIPVTIADLAGVEPFNATDGMSLLPLIDQTAVSWRQDVLAEYYHVFFSETVPTWVSVSDGEWKYVEYAETGETELYDLVNDPYELDNVADDPANASLVAGLSARIAEIRDGEPLGATTTSLPGAAVGLAYSASLEAAGGRAPYAWVLTDGALPDGLSVDSAGEISGVPATTGTFDFTMTVVDGVGATDPKELSIDVADSLPVVALTKTASPASVTEPGGDVTFSVLVENLGATAVTLESLIDDVHGDLSGQGDCSVPQSIAAASSYACSFVATVSGSAGTSETDTVLATGTDTEGTPVSASDTATVTIEAEADVVTILRADWFQNSGFLLVEASSSQGGEVELTVEGFGRLVFQQGVHRRGFPNVTANPGSITVTSTGGGSATAAVTVR